ncbi:MAG: hypothetical protein DRP51_09480 [Candidatus Zixiibacteriota bacterium]|nr:MAG: hypothetical protein DRP51_09480 [candidate division Zixibacteria bacterium]HHI02675.1 hypothetical protein [candidate division Zixibacteria bacterium]
MSDSLKIKKRKLPHWTQEGSVYFVTFRSKSTQFAVEERKLILRHIIRGNNNYYTLIATVVMPDHVHILLVPQTNFSLSRIMKGIKGVTAKKINQCRNQKGSIWQAESYDRIIRDNDELIEKLQYMLNNPLKKGITKNPWTYSGWYIDNNFLTK